MISATQKMGIQNNRNFPKKIILDLLLMNAHLGIDYLSTVSSLSGIKKAYIQHLGSNKEKYSIDQACNVVHDLIKSSGGFSHIVASHNSFGKDIIPRLAGSLGVQPITDVISILVYFQFLNLLE